MSGGPSLVVAVAVGSVGILLLLWLGCGRQNRRGRRGR